MPISKDNRPRRVQSTANIGGRTKQAFAKDADPNTLMRRFTKTGDTEIFKKTNAVAMHGDFSKVPDFFTALLQVQAVEEDFAGLPSQVRNHCDNSASSFIEMISDPTRIDECIELGVFPPDQEESLSVPQPALDLPAPAEPQPEELPEV